ncbi:hypothetical protein EYF80_047405 [Liparis tanakae]|uniref:Uncharacterized protein n=1 Tax=Liparis tanakae TaxID=230148 RepID=A0A4Z2FMG6_9TELE|nr:hypothetical protein EYF80_047405 [Liparis tanakae]
MKEALNSSVAPLARSILPPGPCLDPDYVGVTEPETCEDSRSSAGRLPTGEPTQITGIKKENGKNGARCERRAAFELKVAAGPVVHRSQARLSLHPSPPLSSAYTGPHLSQMGGRMDGGREGERDKDEEKGRRRELALGLWIDPISGFHDGDIAASVSIRVSV